jgi:CRP-like cAMP-binding protein
MAECQKIPPAAEAHQEQAGCKKGETMQEKVKKIVRDLQDETNLFHLFGEEDVEKIAPYFERAHFGAGGKIFREGAPADCIAFVTSGEVEVKKETEFQGKEIVLARMTKGAILGELALFDSQPRSATVEATRKTELLVLRKGALDTFIEDYPALGIKILKGISRVLSLRLRQLEERLVDIF